MTEAVHRPTCYRCMRPVPMCWCADVPVVESRTGFVVLQHPKERFHPFGTARLVALALPRARVVVPWSGLYGNLTQPVEVPPDAAVLFPHPDAEDLAALPPAERPRTLVVLDGTWSHARRLYHENPWLHRLRHVRLHPAVPSNYRIRREPQADYLSTVESVALALELLEPGNPAPERLRAAFARVIDRQVRHTGHQAAAKGRFKVRRERPSRRLPAELSLPGLAVAYGETALPGGDPAAGRELVQWAAVRCDDGAVFEAILRPRGGLPPPHHLGHMRLTAAQVEGGADLAEVRAAFAAWLGGRDRPLAAWSPLHLEWARDQLGWRGTAVPLKTAYCNLRNHRAGVLEDVLRREGLAPATVACAGRARERLGNALAVARWLRQAPAEVTPVAAGE